MPGAQYEVRLARPPEQVDPPVAAGFVVEALVELLPKKM
jgi:hypothetical protein